MTRVLVLVALSVGAGLGAGAVVRFRRSRMDGTDPTPTFYQHLFEASPFGIVLLGSGGAILDANESAARILGYTRAELRARTLADIASRPPVEAARDPTGNETARLRTRNGAIVEASVTQVPAAAHLAGRALLLRNSAIVQSVERQMEQAQKMEAIGRLAGGIAHDFNNMLTAITGYAELLITSEDHADPVVHNAYQIRRAALSAARLTRQLLAFCRQQRAHMEPTDLNATVARIVGMLRRLVGEDVSVHLELEPGVRPVMADPSHIEQVIMNLAVNARDAMPDGGRLVIATSSHVLSAPNWLMPAGEYVQLTVSDTGCGIAPEVQPNVFEPFFTTKGVEGTGLGLATVYGIVKQHGGYIQLDSEVGRGTTFRIDLPVTGEPIAAAPDAARPQLVRGIATVLVVEDEPFVRELAQAVLERAGYEVIAAAGPVDALAELKKHPAIALVVTDVVMPVLNGYDLAEKIRRIAPDLPVLFMSGFAESASRPAQGPLITKPFTVESLTTAVQAALELAS